MRPFPLGLALTAVLLLAPAAEAARFDVSISGSTMRVRLAQPGNDDPTHLQIQPVGGTTRLLFRLIDTGQADAFGETPESCSRQSRSELNCSETVTDALTKVDIVLGNGDDTVETGLVRVPLSISSGDGVDRLSGGMADDVLDVGAGRRGEVETAAGGNGNDTLRRTYRFDPQNGDRGGVNFSGGNDDDTITAFPVVIGGHQAAIDGGFVNRLSGGAGDDRITGSAGRDEIFGHLENVTGAGDDDTIAALGGDDVIDPGAGDDTVDAGAGDDLVIQGGNPAINHLPGPHPDGADTIIGGPGRDTVDYSVRIATLLISPNDSTANDGHDGERDNLQQVEVVEGSSKNDTFFGAASVNDNLPDVFRGNSGDDLLISGDGDDTLDGGRGADRLRAGSDNDLLLAQDGERDTEISCGTGRDVAIIDLKDPAPTECETVVRQPVREEPNVDILGPQTLRRRAGRIRVTLRCRPSARSGCRGRIALAGGPSTRYRLRKGTRRVVSIRAPRVGRTTLVARQTGKKGPKTTTVRVRVR